MTAISLFVHKKLQRPAVVSQYIAATVRNKKSCRFVLLRFVMKFSGTQSYVATDDLKLAVNAAITLERPLFGTRRARYG